MNNYHYQKTNSSNKKIIVKILGLMIFLSGIISLSYFSLPVIASYALIQHVYATNSFAAPVPRMNILTTGSIKALASSALSSFQNTDYTNAKTWFPSYEIHPASPRIEGYKLSIPKIGIDNAHVSTKDYNVGIHLINYGGTAVPPDRGNAVIFGHSTLPQLFSMKDYKTIFAKLHMLEKGDLIITKVEDRSYSYKVQSLSIVHPEDFSPLMQQYDNSYLTLITCTPPGTTIERLIIKAILVE